MRRSLAAVLGLVLECGADGGRQSDAAVTFADGALFVVDGMAKRVVQRDEAGYTTDVWGEATLQGDVDVVLDSSMEGERDSDIWVRPGALSSNAKDPVLGGRGRGLFR